ERPDPVRAQGRDQEEEPEEEAGVTDAVHQECLLAGGRVLGLFVPEADQEIGAEPHPLPADEEQQEVVGQHQDEHRGHAEVEVGEEARESPVAVHVPDRVNVDEEAHPGHDQRHDGRERVESERGVGLERTGDDPGVDAIVEGGAGGEPEELERVRHHHPEGRRHDPRSHHLDGARPAHAEEEGKQHPCRRERDDPAQGRRLDHHRRLISSSALVVSRQRKTARMIARPTAASAAATVMTKNTITWPSIEPRLRAIATNARLTAFSMISIAMKMMMTFRRTSTPSTPTVKSTALRPGYQASGGGFTSSPS